MKRMRSKTILLDVKKVGANMYVLPNHNDYEYIDIYISLRDASDARTIRVYREHMGNILQNGFCYIAKDTEDIMIEKQTDNKINIFVVGWK